MRIGVNYDKGFEKEQGVYFEFYNSGAGYVPDILDERYLAVWQQYVSAQRLLSSVCSVLKRTVVEI